LVQSRTSTEYKSVPLPLPFLPRVNHDLMPQRLLVS
jgi:hypothetical protein